MKNIGDEIDKLLSNNNTSKYKRSLILKEAWEKIAPKSILEHTDNVVDGRQAKNSILVYVDSPQCAASLSMSKEYYRQMMEYETGFDISEIFFKVSSKTGIRKDFSKKEEEKPWYIEDVESVPLDNGELEYIKMTISVIEDEQLKETLFNAMLSDMEWKKGQRQAKKPHI